MFRECYLSGSRALNSLAVNANKLFAGFRISARGLQSFHLLQQESYYRIQLNKAPHGLILINWIKLDNAS